MIKRIGLLVILTLFLASCGTKKRATARKKQNAKAKVLYKSKEGAYPLPVDTGEFVRFNIISVKEYIEKFSEVAQYEMKAYGIPASITLAQGILESGAGRSELTRKTNNHFGIKCHKNWEGAYDFHDDDEKGECFRKYNHPMYSYRDHSEFLSSRARYAFLFDFKITDYKKWAKGLRQAGYATDRRYPQKLIGLIEKYKLDAFDKVSLHKKYVDQRDSKKYEYKVHKVEIGDTLYSLSRKYFVSVLQLKELNKLKSDTISIGQELMVKTQTSN
ncbi:MAG: glucosaminidase domain-containing protein [Cellulophaga sp.]